jgi:hypothetical protein
MTDQRSKAGNIGDILKHLLVAEEVSFELGRSPDKELFCFETHAGYYHYGPGEVGRLGAWKADRAWSLGPVEKHLREGGKLGLYGEVLRAELGETTFYYPGTLKVLDKAIAAADRPRLRLLGFESGSPQVASYGIAGEGIKVQLVPDGYAATVEAIKQLPEEARVIVSCDPPWVGDSSAAELEKVEALLALGRPTVLCCPAGARHQGIREFAIGHDGIVLDVRFEHRQEARPAGRVAEGAAIAFFRFPTDPRQAIAEPLRALLAAFQGQTAPLAKDPEKTRQLDLLATSTVRIK